MKASRLKKDNEQLPAVEINSLGKRFQVCYNFQEVEKEGETLFEYDYVNVNDNSRETIISAIIRKKYTADQVEATINNFLESLNIIDYLKLQNYRKFAKAIADQNENAIISSQQAEVYKVSLPFDQTINSGDYENLSNRMLKVKMNFKVDLATNKAIAYPSWISSADLQILQSDPRVIIESIALYD